MCWLQQSAQLWYYPTFLLVPLMILAGLECFAGYLVWRFILGVNGAVLGFVAGALLGVVLGPMLAVITALAGAVAGAVLLARIVPLGSFIVGFGSAASFSVLITYIVKAPDWCVVPLAGIAGLAGAIAAVVDYRPFIITLASVAGAQQLASAWRAYSLPYDSIPLSGDVSSSESTAFVTLAVIGLLLQFTIWHVSGRHRHQPEETVPPTQVWRAAAD